MRYSSAYGGAKMPFEMFKRLALDSQMSIDILNACQDVLVRGLTQTDAASVQNIRPAVVSRAIKVLLSQVPDDGGAFATNYEVLKDWWNRCVVVLPQATSTGFALRADLALFAPYRTIGTMQFGRFMERRGFPAKLRKGRTYYGSGREGDPGPKLVYLLDRDAVASSGWEKEALRMSSGQHKAMASGYIDKNTGKAMAVDELPEYFKPALDVPADQRPTFAEPRPMKMGSMPPRAAWEEGE